MKDHNDGPMSIGPAPGTCCPDMHVGPDGVCSGCGSTAERRAEYMTPWALLSDGTRWPDPVQTMQCEWRLRYGRELGKAPTHGDELLAASVLAAYQSLLYAGTTKEAIRHLREMRRRCRP